MIEVFVQDRYIQGYLQVPDVLGRTANIPVTCTGQQGIFCLGWLLCTSGTLCILSILSCVLYKHRFWPTCSLCILLPTTHLIFHFYIYIQCIFKDSGYHSLKRRAIIRTTATGPLKIWAKFFSLILLKCIQITALLSSVLQIMDCGMKSWPTAPKHHLT